MGGRRWAGPTHHYLFMWLAAAQPGPYQLIIGGPRPGPGHPLFIWWAAARPDPSFFPEEGPRLGPAHPMLQLSRPGPARSINSSSWSARLSPAHDIFYFFGPARPGPCHSRRGPWDTGSLWAALWIWRAGPWTGPCVAPYKKVHAGGSKQYIYMHTIDINIIQLSFLCPRWTPPWIKSGSWNKNHLSMYLLKKSTGFRFLPRFVFLVTYWNQVKGKIDCLVLFIIIIIVYFFQKQHRFNTLTQSPIWSPTLQTKTRVFKYNHLAHNILSFPFLGSFFLSHTETKYVIFICLMLVIFILDSFFVFWK